MESLTLEDLSAEVSRLLREHGLASAAYDGRVSPLPDARTIRYYTTLGLLDRPLIAGRQARYGRRHVLQLMAVKALQAAGLPLADIQGRLYGKSDAELESMMAGIPRRGAALRVVRWREIAIEPGLKLVAEEGWTPATAPDVLEEHLQAALRGLINEGGRP